MSSIEQPCIEPLGQVAGQPSMSGAVSREQPISQKTKKIKQWADEQFVRLLALRSMR